MGISVSIGVAESKERVKFQESPDAPAIEGSWMKPRINAHDMTIGGWHNAIRRLGLFNLVDCDDYGCWEAGMYRLTEGDAIDVELAYARCLKKHPGVQPRFKASEEESDVAIVTWIAWWVRWAKCESMPTYIQVSY